MLPLSSFREGMLDLEIAASFFSEATGFDLRERCVCCIRRCIFVAIGSENFKLLGCLFADSLDADHVTHHCVPADVSALQNGRRRATFVSTLCFSDRKSVHCRTQPRGLGVNLHRGSISVFDNAQNCHQTQGNEQ